eukprot:1739891-Ditylum_brightwellii.AAC.1
MMIDVVEESNEEIQEEETNKEKDDLDEEEADEEEAGENREESLHALIQREQDEDSDDKMEDDVEESNVGIQEEEEKKEGDEALPIEDRGKKMLEEIYNEMEEKDGSYELECILDHEIRKGVMIFKVAYYNEKKDKRNMMEVPFNVLKKDILMDLARYIKQHVVEESQRKG